MIKHSVEIPTNSKADFITAIRQIAVPLAGFKITLETAHDRLRVILKRARARGDKLGRTVYRPIQFESLICEWLRELVASGTLIEVGENRWRHEDARRAYEEGLRTAKSLKEEAL